MLKLSVPLKKMPLFFLGALSVVTLIDATSVFLRFGLGYEKLDRFLPIFSLGSDSSLPTWYASFSLLCCSLLCVLIAIKINQDKEKYFWHWMILAIIFCFISIDEVARIHETFGGWIEDNFPTVRKGIFYYSWVLLAIPLISIFALSYLKFIIQLPHLTKRFFILALVTYIAGGLGIEMLGANYHYYSSNDTGTLTYSILVIAEEFLEKIGVLSFICAFVCYIKKRFKQVQILLE